MTPLMYLRIALLAASLIGGFTAGYKVESWHANALQKAAVEAAVAEYKGEAEKANVQSAALEQQLEKSHAQTRAQAQQLASILARPIYSRDCLDDDGVRAANSALTGAPAPAGGPAGPVPGPNPAQ